MANEGTPVVYDQTLLRTGQPNIHIGTLAWFQWLETVSSFSYQRPHRLIRLTLRKEIRRHRFYWYAYTKYDALLYNAYVGASHSLTHEKLSLTLDKITDKVRRDRKNTPN